MEPKKRYQLICYVLLCDLHSMSVDNEMLQENVDVEVAAEYHGQSGND